jgi:hypothetical protein
VQPEHSAEAANRQTEHIISYSLDKEWVSNKLMYNHGKKIKVKFLESVVRVVRYKNIVVQKGYSKP